MIRRLVSLGSVIVDLVLELPMLPERGGDVLASQRGMAAGGAFNVLSAAGRLGLPGVYVGSHGTGPFGELVRKSLAREGIEVSQPANPDLDTGWTLALIEPDGERTFVTVTGADGLVESAALSAIRYREGDVVYISGYDLAYPGAGVALADHVERLGRDVTVIFDPGPLVAEIPSEHLDAVLHRIDVLSLNEREAEALGGVEAVSPRLAATATVIIRRGARGAILRQAGQEPLSIPAVQVQAAVDTSGAGDVHVGATLAGLAREMIWPEAVLFANRASAYAVSRRGPAAGPTAAQLREFGSGRW